MKESIIFGAVILMITNFFVKILSLVYRGVLIRLIGGEGLGLWEMISPIFSLILVVASWGIPLAISNLVSRDIERKYTMSIVNRYDTAGNYRFCRIFYCNCGFSFC